MFVCEECSDIAVSVFFFVVHTQAGQSHDQSNHFIDGTDTAHAHGVLTQVTSTPIKSLINFIFMRRAGAAVGFVIVPTSRGVLIIVRS